MNRTSKRGPSRGTSRKSSPKSSPRRAGTEARKTSARKGKRGPAFGGVLVSNLLLLCLTGFLGYRLVEMNRTLKDRTQQIQMLQSQLLSARTQKSASEEHRPLVEPPSSPSITQKHTPRQQAILKRIVNTPDIGQLIPQKPSLGGQWQCFSEEHVFFLDRNHVAFTYEDGHTKGAAVVEVRDPQKRSTWKLIWSGPL